MNTHFYFFYTVHIFVWFIDCYLHDRSKLLKKLYSLSNNKYNNNNNNILDPHLVNILVLCLSRGSMQSV